MCSGLASLEQANTKFSRGYASTGCVLGVCTRHEFVQKNGVVDTQIGERWVSCLPSSQQGHYLTICSYANVDYAMALLLFFLDHRLTKVFSYDIACQWSKYLIERLKQLPPLLRLNLTLQIIYFVIPKLHIHGHQLLCLLHYSLNWLWGAGRTVSQFLQSLPLSTYCGNISCAM
jgi:hypothetical protein